MTRNEFLVCQRLKPLNPLRDVIMTLAGTYNVKFESIPTETALAELEFEVVKHEGKHFTLRDLRPVTQPDLMNAAEALIHQRLTDHYGHIGSVSASTDGGFVVQLMGGKLDDEFLADVTRKTGLQVINHNHSSFTVRAAGDAQPAIDEPTPADDDTRMITPAVEPPVGDGDTQPWVLPPLPPAIPDLVYPQRAQVDHLIAALETDISAAGVEPDPDSYYAEKERAHEAALDAQQDEREVQQFFDVNGFMPIPIADPEEAAIHLALEADAATETAWATPALSDALHDLLGLHSFFPDELHPTAATHHWLIENRGSKANLRARLEAAGLDVLNVSQDYLDDAPYSLATIRFDGAPAWQTEALAADPKPDFAPSIVEKLQRRIVDLQTALGLQAELAEHHKDALDNAERINRLQSDMLREALSAQPPFVEIDRLIQDLDDLEAEADLADMINAGWTVVSETVNTYVDDFTDGLARVKHIRITRLERRTNTQPQPDQRASVEVDALLGHLPRNGAPAPAPRPSVYIDPPQRIPAYANKADKFPIARAIHRDGLAATREALNAQALGAAQTEFQRHVQPISSRPLTMLPTGN